MSNSLAIRADVARGNEAVEKAQQSLRLAVDQLAEAKQIYISIESDNPNLRAAIGAVSQTENLVDDALRNSFGITPQADLYAARV
jgi:hypothetical protein